TPDDLEMARARTRIEAGSRILRSELERAWSIRKGATIEVLRLDRGVSIRFPAIAMEDGLTGDQISIRRVGAPASTSFLGRVEGPGRATVLLEGGMATTTNRKDHR
ncbi:MAG: flagella basal body P-ring formation protein FlgA, partial [Phycisphaerales bacterium]|nr:flagella basal body P-ring formation protein FlgA [Phycisphaerales bacterium]